MDERINALLEGMTDEARDLAEVCLAVIKEGECLRKKRIKADKSSEGAGITNNGSGHRKLYKKIKFMCRERGMRVCRLAESIGIPETTINKWDSVEPGIWKVKQVADYFGVSLDEFIS